MKKFGVIAFLLLVGVGIVGCKDSGYFYGEENVISIDKFRVDTIIPQVVNLPDYIVSGGITLIGDDLFITDSRNDSVLIKVYDFNTGTYKAGLMPQGRGAGEFMNIFSMGQMMYENGEYKSLYSGPYYDSLYCLNYTKSVNSGKTVIDDVFSKDEISGLSDIRETIISMTKMSKTKWLITITGKSATLNGRDYFPPTLYIADKGDTMQYPMYKKPILNDDPNADGYMNLMLTSASMMPKPDGSKMAYLSSVMSRLSIFDAETGEYKHIIGEGEPDVDDVMMPTVFTVSKVSCYDGICVDDNYIYALWSGKLTTPENREAYINEIRVFDWDGNLVVVLPIALPGVRSAILNSDGSGEMLLRDYNEKLYMLNVNDYIPN